MTYDIIIIGGGCAGLTAAVYARRAGKSALVLEAETFGGQIAFSPNVENFPGFQSVSGVEFSDRLMTQALDLGAEIELERVTGIEEKGGHKLVTTEYGEYEGKAVIIAAGLKHRMLGIPGEEDLIGKGISFCATCDGAFYQDKVVGVFGGGNTALTDALFLADLCKDVLIIHRRNQFRGDEALVARLKERSNVTFLLEHVVSGLRYADELTGITVKNTVSGEEKEIPVDGLFVAIGRIPNNEFLKGRCKTDDYGYILASEDCKTNISGIFTAGDCRTKEVRQLTTAAADGSIAALAACNYIDSLK